MSSSCQNKFGTMNTASAAGNEQQADVFIPPGQLSAVSPSARPTTPAGVPFGVSQAAGAPPFGVSQAEAGAPLFGAPQAAGAPFSGFSFGAGSSPPFKVSQAAGAPLFGVSQAAGAPFSGVSFGAGSSPPFKVSQAAGAAPPFGVSQAAGNTSSGFSFAAGSAPPFGVSQAARPVTAPMAQWLSKKLLSVPASLRHEVIEAISRDSELKWLVSCGVTKTTSEAPSKESMDRLVDACIQRAQDAGSAPACSNQTQHQVLDAESSAPAVSTATVDSTTGQPALSLLALPEFAEYGVGKVKDLQMVVSVNARKDVARKAKMSLACVLDRSGSMSGSRIKLVKATMHFLIDSVTDSDYLCIISYSSEVTVDLPLMRMSPSVKAYAHTLVDALRADGGTNLWGGLEKGMQQQLSMVVDDVCMVKAVLLCTDGEANQGPSTADAILPLLARMKGANGETVTTHCFGFGDGHDSRLLQAISEVRNGDYYYITKNENIPDAFGDSLGGLMSVVAKDVKLTLTPVNGSEIAVVKSGGVVSKEATIHRLSFWDIFAEERRDALVKLTVPAGSFSDVLHVHMSYVDVATGETVICECEGRITRKKTARPGLSNELVESTAARYAAAEAIKDATKKREAGDINGARAGFDQAIATMRATAADSGTPEAYFTCIEQMDAVKKTIDDAASAAHETNQTMSIMTSAFRGLQNQRATCAGISCALPSNQAYDTSSKSAWRSNAMQSPYCFGDTPTLSSKQFSIAPPPSFHAPMPQPSRLQASVGHQPPVQFSIAPPPSISFSATMPPPPPLQASVGQQLPVQFSFHQTEPVQAPIQQTPEEPVQQSEPMDTS